MQIEVSIGEIVDKLSILDIKKQNITIEAKLINVRKEFNYLYEIVFEKLKIERSDYEELLKINTVLWKIEDDIRIKEYKKEFDDTFTFLARNVYISNDERAKIKKNINIKYKSQFFEEKSYEKY